MVAQWPRRPLRVAADLPLAVRLDHAAELAVRARPEAEPLAPERQLQPERHAAVGGGVVAEVGVAHRALQVREQERHRVGVVPHVGAAPLAATLVDAHPLEAVEGAVLQAQDGGAVEHRQGGGGGVEHRGRHAAGVQRVAERQGIALQPLPLAQAVAGAGCRVGEAGGVPVAPLAGLELRRRPVALLLVRPHRVPVVDAVGEAPGQHEAHAARLPGGHADARRQHPGVIAPEAAAGAVGRLRVAAVGEPAGRGEVVPVDGEVVEPGAAEPVLLEADLRAVGGGGEVAVAGVLGSDAAGAQGEELDAVAACGVVDRLAGPGGVGDRQRHGVIEVVVAGVGDPHLEAGGGDAGVVGVARNERVEGAQGDGARELVVGERKSGDRKGALEFHVREVGQAAQGGARRAEAVAVQPGRAQAAGQRPGQVAVQHPRIHHFAAALRLHGKVAEAVHAALVRAVEDFPVDQPPVAGQPDRAGADPAERKRDLVEPGAAIGEVRTGGFPQPIVAHHAGIVETDHAAGQARIAGVADGRGRPRGGLDGALTTRAGGQALRRLGHPGPGRP